MVNGKGVVLTAGLEDVVPGRIIFLIPVSPM